MHNNRELGNPQGWQCPICKNIYAPHVSRCKFCKTRNELAAYDANMKRLVEQGFEVRAGFGNALQAEVEGTNERLVTD